VVLTTTTVNGHPPSKDGILRIKNDRKDGIMQTSQKSVYSSVPPTEQTLSSDDEVVIVLEDSTSKAHHQDSNNKQNDDPPTLNHWSKFKVVHSFSLEWGQSFSVRRLSISGPDIHTT